MTRVLIAIALAVLDTISVLHHVELSNRIDAEQLSAYAARNRVHLTWPHVLDSVQQK